MSLREPEFGTKMRLLRMMIAIMERPRAYTKKALANLYGVSEDTIKKDFEILRNAGFVLEYDTKYRYRFAEEKPYQQLKQLLHFSEEDQVLLMHAIDTVTINDEKGRKLKRKLSSLYDFRQLGHSYLRRPYLSKVNTLLEAKKENYQVYLMDYRSSTSNNMSNRLVEPFHIDPPSDTLQAYDVDKKVLRHYRISRIKRVKLSNDTWQYEGHHTIMRTDPFRIVDNHQVMVHIRIRLGAYNELVERFPMTRSFLIESEEPEIYDFQCNVNHRFLGLTNFILGFYHQLVEVVGPESLIDHLNETTKKMKF